MTDLTSPRPCAVAIAAETGMFPEATAHYQKHLSDLRGLFLDARLGTTHSKRTAVATLCVIRTSREISISARQSLQEEVGSISLTRHYQSATRGNLSALSAMALSSSRRQRGNLHAELRRAFYSAVLGASINGHVPLVFLWIPSMLAVTSQRWRTKVASSR
jgi:hypothetical protein